MLKNFTFEWILHNFIFVRPSIELNMLNVGRIGVLIRRVTSRAPWNICDIELGLEIQRLMKVS